MRDIDTVIGAKEEFLSSTIASLKELDTALLKVIESFSLTSALGETTKKTVEENKTVFQALGESLDEYYGKYLIATEGMTEAKKIEAAAAIESEGAMKIKEASLKSLGAVHSSVYQGMTDEIMSFIETGKFSVGALGKIVADRVKIELVGIAAIAAVQALFQIGMGFAKLAMYDLVSAKLHFLSAAKLGLVAGASVAAAAGVNSILGKSKDSSSGASSARGGLLSAYPAPGGAEPKQIQNITLQIYNPLSQQNWAEIAENNILPALKAASDMNIMMNVKTVYA